MDLKEKIIHESLRLFSLNGFSNTSLTDIMKACGSSKGGVYNYFKSKEALCIATLEKARLIWKAQVVQDFDAEETQLNKLKTFLRNHCNKYLIDTTNFPGGCVFITLSLEFNDYSPNLSKLAENVFETVKRIIKNFLDQSKQLGEIKENIDVDLASEMVFTALIGSSVLYNNNKSTENLINSVNALIYYIDSLKREGR
jgi:AcrR family transcriptional regulator